MRHVDVFEPISHISKPVGCAPKRGAAETSSPGQASIGFLTQMTGWEWRILGRMGQSIPSSFGKREFSEASKDPNLSNHVFFLKPSSFQTTCCCSTLEHTSEIHQNGFRFTTLFLADSIGSSTFLPLLAISFGRNRLGALDGGNRRCPVSTPFSAMAKAASPLLRPWFSSRSWYLFNEQKL